MLHFELETADANTGAEISILKLNGETTSPAFSPDGTMIAVAQNNQRASTIFLWDVASEKPKALEVRFRIETLSFAEDGSGLLGNDAEGNFYEWKVPKGSLDRAFNAQASGVERGIFRADGAIFVGDGEHGPAILWEAKTGRIIGEFLHDQLAGHPLRISPKGDLAVIGLEDGRMLVINFSAALRPLGILMKDACTWLDQNGGHKFSELEVAADPLIDEAWSHGDSSRQVCTDRRD
jgi:WD40 repeat protein